MVDWCPWQKKSVRTEQFGAAGRQPGTHCVSGGKKAIGKVIEWSILAEDCSRAMFQNLEMRVIKCASTRIPDQNGVDIYFPAVWDVHEQICVAALDCGEHDIAKVCTVRRPLKVLSIKNCGVTFLCSLSHSSHCRLCRASSLAVCG